MAESINITDLAIKPAAALTTADSIVTFTADGDTNQTPMFEAMAKANGENGCLCVQLHSQSIPSAAILTGNATPIAVSITRAVGQSIGVLQPIIGSIDFNSAAYATNTVIGLRFVGANEPIATCNLLGRTASGSVNFVPVTSVGAGDSQYLRDTDLEIYVLSGDPTAGDSVSNVLFPFTFY